MLATSGGDGTIRRWDAVTGEAIGEPSVGHATEQIGDGTGGITGLAFTPDGSQVISGGADATIRFWDAQTGVQVGEPLRADTPEAAGYWDGAESFSEYVNDIAVSRTVAPSRRPGRLDVLWDLESRTQLGEPLGGHDTSVWGVAFSPDGSLLAATDMDGHVLLWDVARRAMIATLLARRAGGGRDVRPTGELLLVRTNGLALWDRRDPADR
jgi:WD40 repeat protein